MVLWERVPSIEWPLQQLESFIQVVQHHSREDKASEMNLRKGKKANLPKNGLELKAKFLSRLQEGSSSGSLLCKRSKDLKKTCLSLTMRTLLTSKAWFGQGFSTGHFHATHCRGKAKLLRKKKTHSYRVSAMCFTDALISPSLIQWIFPEQLLRAKHSPTMRKQHDGRAALQVPAFRSLCGGGVLDGK